MNDLAINRKTPFKDLPELLTPHEVRDFLGLGRDSIYKLVESGELPARRFGQKIFIPKKALMMEVNLA